MILDPLSPKCALGTQFVPTVRGVLTKNPFWLKNGLLSLYLRNRASDFDDFLSDVRYHCT